MNLRHLAALLLACAALAATSCFAPPLRSSSASFVENSELAGFEDVRARDGFLSKPFQTSFTQHLGQRKTLWQVRNGLGPMPYRMLVLSSGGPNGVFGAGVLEGWSEAGTRPEFDTVLGTSVGALLAPFAFLGSEYDPVLREIFAELEGGDLHEPRSKFAILTADSTMSSEPLAELINRRFDMQLLEEIAQAHELGRRLFVGTTNLDSGMFMIWDIGSIAERRTEEARQLACRVLRASAAIPMLYQPVTFDAVEVGTGRPVEELHVDGAVVRPMFLPDQVFNSAIAAAEAGVRWSECDVDLYVISNGPLIRRGELVAARALDIAQSAVATMVFSMMQDDLLHLYIMSRAWGADFHYVSIPEGLDIEDPIDFESPDSAELYQIGRDLGLAQAWRSSPPRWIAGDDIQSLQSVLESRETEALAEIERAKLLGVPTPELLKVP